MQKCTAVDTGLTTRLPAHYYVRSIQPIPWDRGRPCQRLQAYWSRDG